MTGNVVVGLVLSVAVLGGCATTASQDHFSLHPQMGRYIAQGEACATSLVEKYGYKPDSPLVAGCRKEALARYEQQVAYWHLGQEELGREEMESRGFLASLFYNFQDNLRHMPTRTFYYHPSLYGGYSRDAQWQAFSTQYAGETIAHAIRLQTDILQNQTHHIPPGAQNLTP